MYVTEYFKKKIGRIPLPDNFLFYIWLFVLIVLIEVGAYGIVQIHTKPIMPTQPFESYAGVPWRLLVATSVFFVVSTTGLCIVSSLGEVFGFIRLKPVVRMGLLLALVTILVGLMIIGLEIERPLRAPFAFLAHVNPYSLMFWMIMFYALYMLFLIIEMWFILRDDIIQLSIRSPSSLGRFLYGLISLKFLEPVAGSYRPKYRRKLEHEFAKVLGFITVFVAIIAHSNLGAVFGVTYLPFWHGPLMPIYFILSAIISGAAILMFSSIITFWAKGIPIEGEIYDSIQMLRVILGFTLVVGLFFISWKFVAKYYFPSPITREALEYILLGPLMINFWVFELGIGTLIPIFLLAIPVTGRNVKWNLVASLLTIIGIFILRYDLIIGGLLGKSISGITYRIYSPHIFEIMAVAGFFALTALIYTLGMKILPIIKIRGKEGEA